MVIATVELHVELALLHTLDERAPFVLGELACCLGRIIAVPDLDSQFFHLHRDAGQPHVGDDGGRAHGIPFRVDPPALLVYRVRQPITKTLSPLTNSSVFPTRQPSGFILW